MTVVRGINSSDEGIQYTVTCSGDEESIVDCYTEINASTISCQMVVELDCDESIH